MLYNSIKVPRTKLTELLKAINEKVGVTEYRLKENKLSADLSSKSARTSWSAAGEREYTTGQLTINQKAFDQIAKLQKEVGEAVGLPISEKVEVPCFITIKTSAEVSDIYLVENVTNIEKYKIVSSESVLGKALVGKKVGEIARTSSGVKVEVIEIA